MTTQYIQYPPASSGAGSGTVTSVSVVSANGLAGTVANPSTTPAITLTTTITGLLKGSGTAISAAVAGTDYQAAGNYITALTGDGTASGPGSAAFTLATVNSNVGSFNLANITVNAKGLITAASAASTTGSGSVVLSTSPTISGATHTGTTSFPGTSSIDGSGNAVLGGSVTAGDVKLTANSISNTGVIQNTAAGMSLLAANGSTITYTGMAATGALLLLLETQHSGQAALVMITEGTPRLVLIANGGSQFSITAGSTGDGLYHLSNSGNDLVITNQTGFASTFRAMLLRTH